MSDGPTRAWLARRAPARVIVETCTEAFRMAGAARSSMGHDVRVVAATLVRALGVGQRGLKNDQRDARTLSEASCRIELPSVHIPSTVSQEVKAICVSREALIKTRTQLVNRVRSYVRSRLGQPLRATPESLPKHVRRALLLDAEGLPAHLERLLVVLETVSEQIAAADAELKELAAEDARMRRLMTVPGVGPVTAARFVAALDQVERFPNASRVASYLGLGAGRRHHGLSREAQTIDPGGCATSAMGAGASRLVAVSSPPDGSDGAMGETGSLSGEARASRLRRSRESSRTSSLRCGNTRRRTTRRGAHAPSSPRKTFDLEH